MNRQADRQTNRPTDRKREKKCKIESHVSLWYQKAASVDFNLLTFNFPLLAPFSSAFFFLSLALTCPEPCHYLNNSLLLLLQLVFICLSIPPFHFLLHFSFFSLPSLLLLLFLLLSSLSPSLSLLLPPLSPFPSPHLFLIPPLTSYLPLPFFPQSPPPSFFSSSPLSFSPPTTHATTITSQDLIHAPDPRALYTHTPTYPAKRGGVAIGAKKKRDLTCLIICLRSAISRIDGFVRLHARAFCPR